MTKASAAKIEQFIAAGRWKAAEERVLRELRKDAQDHWLWARLSAIEYQQYRYDQALNYAERALTLAPDCALALWERAESLYMLHRYPQAVAAFKELVDGGIARFLSRFHHEGRLWSRALVSDAYYRLAWALNKNDEYASALKAVRCALALRGHGAKPLYPISELQQLQQTLESELAFPIRRKR